MLAFCLHPTPAGATVFVEARMATLTIRNVPEDLVERIKEVAARQIRRWIETGRKNPQGRGNFRPFQSY